MTTRDIDMDAAVATMLYVWATAERLVGPDRFRAALADRLDQQPPAVREIITRTTRIADRKEDDDR